MNKYIPCLKAKQNEIKAICELSQSIRDSICPLFDFPRKAGGYNEIEFKKAAQHIALRLTKNLGKSFPFYFDNFDLDDDLTVNGEHNYCHILQVLAGLEMIPVVGLDRSEHHNESVFNFKQNGALKSDVVAFRVSPEDFVAFGAVEEDIEESLQEVFDLFNEIDLIFDCRVCSALNAATVAPQILDFSKKLCAGYSVRRVVVVGSSIPASIRDVLTTDSEKILVRNELMIFSAVKKLHNHAPIIFGDYATVSPNYSDVDLPPEILWNVMTAKFVYTIPGAHYFIRGEALKGNGSKQYFAMAKHLCSQPFFRKKKYSSGDAYFEEKSLGQGNNCAPNSVIKPAVIAHITYMVRDSGV